MPVKFSSPTWNYRLQILWILFTGLFVTLGTYTKARLVSSILITIGAFLVLAVMSHVLHEKDLSKTKPTFLLALGSLLFLAQEATKVYNDILGTIFCLVMATACLALAWIEDQKASKVIKYYFFATLILIVVCSSMQLTTTLLIKGGVRFSIFPSSSYIISPHALGINIGMMVGFAFGLNIIAHRRIDFNRHNILFSFAFFYGVGCVSAYSFNDLRLGRVFLNITAQYIYTSLYIFIYCAVPLFFTWAYIKGKNLSRLNYKQYIDITLIMPILLALLVIATHLFMKMIWKVKATEYLLMFISEFTIALSLALSILFSIKICRFISNLMYHDFKEFSEIMHNKQINAD